MKMFATKSIYKQTLGCLEIYSEVSRVPRSLISKKVKIPPVRFTRMLYFVKKEIKRFHRGLLTKCKCLGNQNTYILHSLQGAETMADGGHKLWTG